MFADRYASNVRLSSVFAREFCPLCIGDDESIRESSARRDGDWTCPECSAPVDNPEDIVCLACVRALACDQFAAE